MRRCDACGASRELSQLYQPHSGPILYCQDKQACQQRGAYSLDPALALMDEERPAPLPPSKPACCGICGVGGDLISQSGILYCRDCQVIVDMGAVTEDFADDLITSAEMRAMQAAAPVVIPAEHPAPTQHELDVASWQSRMGSKRTV